MAGNLRVEFHESLDDLRNEIVRLGALVVETIGRGTAAVLDRDLQLAQRMIDDDDILDVAAVSIEESCYRLLALQQPMARDLRFVVCSLHMANELERSGDLMVNICKSFRRVYDSPMPPVVRSLIEDMSIEAASLTRKALDAFVDEDGGLAAALDDIDDRLDDLQTDFVEAVFRSDVSDNTRMAVQMALIGRYYERIGDHAVNMGERINFMVTGWLPEHAALARVEARHRRAVPVADGETRIGGSASPSGIDGGTGTGPAGPVPG
ncbi:MAG: phosphate signaling complex protein PhoU [Microthrixaceae bacterium]